jgi:hypothetical protein
MTGDDGGMDQNTSVVSKSEQRAVKEDAATRWRKLIEQQRESGMPVSAYCRERGLSAASMFAWRRRLRPASALPGAGLFKSVKIVRGGQSPVRSAGKQADSAIELPAVSFVELCLPGERRLMVRRGFDRELLLELIDALEGKPSALQRRS